MSYLRNQTMISSAGLEPVIGIFGEQLVGTKYDDINVEFIYPYYNTEFDLQPFVSTGDGAVSVTNAELKVSSTTTGTALAKSKDSVRYRAGHTGFAAFTASLKATGDNMAGCFDEVDGFFIRRNAGVMSVGRRRSGTDFEVTIDSWEGDDLTGIDFSKINIYQITFGYLGVASPVFQIKHNGSWKTLHVLNTEGVIDTTTVSNPNFPISVYAANGGEVRTASWNAGVINGDSLTAGSRFFTLALSKTLSGTDLATIGTFLNKPTYKTINNKVKIFLLRYQFLIDAPDTGVGTVELKIRKNCTLTGTETLVDVDVDNSVVATDGVRTYASGGKDIYIEYLHYASGAGNAAKTAESSQLPADRLGLYLLPNETATITAQNVSGNTNVTVRTVFNWTELF